MFLGDPTHFCASAIPGFGLNLPGSILPPLKISFSPHFLFPGAVVGAIVWYASGAQNEEFDPILDEQGNCSESIGGATIYLTKTFPNNKSVTFEYVRSKVIHSKPTLGSDFAEKVGFI